MPKQVRVRKGLYASQAQQSPQNTLSANSISTDMLAPDLRAKFGRSFFADAVVGSASALSLGYATHTSITSAIASLPTSGGIIYVLAGTYGESITIGSSVTNMHIFGVGNASVISGNLSISGNNNLIRALRVSGAISTSGRYNFIKEIWMPNTGTLTDSGVDNVYEVIREV